MQDIVNIAIQGDEYQFIKDYKDNKEYRNSLNRLAKKIHGLDFEDWYQQGYWKDRYHPYSLTYQGEVVANVSASNIDYILDGKRHSAVQIGTVMTAEAFRMKGLSRVLMDLVLKDFENTCELIYLYANDTVLNFYPKFGFTEANETTFTGTLTQTGDKLKYRKLDQKNVKDKAILTRLVEDTIPVARISMVDNPGLDMFYLTSFLADQIYYIDSLDLAAVVEYKDEKMQIVDIFSERQFDLKQVIHTLSNENTRKVSLGFTPCDTTSFEPVLLMEEGSTFFVKGKNFVGIGRFPMLSHA